MYRNLSISVHTVQEHWSSIVDSKQTGEGFDQESDVLVFLQCCGSGFRIRMDFAFGPPDPNSRGKNYPQKSRNCTRKL
jgi:hypothetical protein